MPRDMFIIPVVILYCNGSRYSNMVVYIHIGVGSALLVSINWAMREPLECGTGNRYRFSRFSYIIINKVYTHAESGELIGKGEKNKIFNINL